jgi:hypothetical protein
VKPRRNHIHVAIPKRDSSKYRIGEGGKMNTVATTLTLTHGFVGTNIGAEISTTSAVLCGVALTVFSMVTSYGIDLSPGCSTAEGLIDRLSSKPD